MAERKAARHEPGLNGIDFEIYPHGRDRTRSVLSSYQSPSAPGENHINFEACEFKCELGEKFRLVVRGSVLKCDVPSLYVSGLAEPLHECIPVGRRRRRDVGRSRNGEVTDPVACALLRTRRERPRSRAAEQRDELAPSDEEGHLIPPAERPTAQRLHPHRFVSDPGIGAVEVVILPLAGEAEAAGFTSDTQNEKCCRSGGTDVK